MMAHRTLGLQLGAAPLCRSSAFLSHLINGLAHYVQRTDGTGRREARPLPMKQPAQIVDWGASRLRGEKERRHRTRTRCAGGSTIGGGRLQPPPISLATFTLRVDGGAVDDRGVLVHEDPWRILAIDIQPIRTGWTQHFLLV